MAKIPTARFNLKSPQAKDETLIFLIYRYRGKKLLYSTGLNIKPSEWNFKAQRPIELERRKDLWVIRRLLDDLAIYCKSTYIETDYGQISVEDFKDQLDKQSSKKEGNADEKIIHQPENKRPTFLEFLDLELQEMETGGMKPRSIHMFRCHCNNIKRFAQDIGTFDYEDVDWNLRLQFIDWLSEQNLKLTYGNIALKTLRQFLERARRKRLHTNTAYEGMGWTVTPKKAKGKIVTLNVEELEQLANLSLPQALQPSRDLCLIGAGTGQRFSDFSRYTPQHFYRTIKGTLILSVNSQKTATPAKVPLNIFPWLIPVLEKYDFNSPKISMCKFNQDIKTVCQLAGIDEQTLKLEQYISRTVKIVESYVPKYTEIASHTCRRSFATNLYRMGYRLSQIMPMTGHTTEAQLRQYIGIDEEENAEEIALSIIARQNQAGQTDQKWNVGA